MHFLSGYTFRTHFVNVWGTVQEVNIQNKQDFCRLLFHHHHSRNFHSNQASITREFFFFLSACITGLAGKFLKTFSVYLKKSQSIFFYLVLFWVVKKNPPSPKKPEYPVFLDLLKIFLPIEKNRNLTSPRLVRFLFFCKFFLIRELLNITLPKCPLYRYREMYHHHCF